MKKKTPVHMPPTGPKKISPKSSDTGLIKQALDQAKLLKKTPPDTITLK